MAVQNSDDFNRVGATLGASWTALNGGAAPAFNTDLRTNGNYAHFGTGGQIHGAILSGTTQANALVQCWIQIPAAGNNAGIIFRFQDIDNFYLLRIGPGINGIALAERVAGTYTNITTFATAAAAGTWVRYSIRMIGNAMQVYFNANHLITNSGPNMVATDNSFASPGGCGIISTGNNAGGTTTTFWNDFVVRDGSPDVIYVDTGFNGGALGEGMGTETRPDLGIDWALNNCGCEQGSKIKIQSTATITNALAPVLGNDGQYAINHRGRWSPSGASFATYDDANGHMTSAGNPALTIEGPDGATRCVLQETRNTDFFSTTGTAAFKSGGLCVRGIQYRGTGGTSSALTSASGANNAGDSSYAIEKCQLDAETATSGVLRVVSNGSAARIQIVYNYFRALVANVTSFVRITTGGSVDSLLVRMNVLDASTASMANSASTGAVSVLTGGCEVGDAWDIDHNTFVEIRSAGTTDSALNFDDAGELDGSAEFQNNIVFGQANPDETGVGFRIAAGAVSGSTNAHHNGYLNVLTPRSASVTNGGNEIDSSDPVFVAPNSGFKWRHTGGSGLLGEGTFTPIDLDGDYRPSAPAYLDSADDSNPLLGVLDRGALQNFIEPSPSPSGGSDVVPIVEDAYCVSVVFDPRGPQHTELSGALITARPLRLEKDVLLRRYKAADAELEFADTESLFVESNPASFLRLNGRPDWFGKRVEVNVTFGTTLIVRFVGFVLDVRAERGRGFLQIANRFQALTDRPVRANTMGKLVSTTRFPGIGPSSSTTDLNAPDQGFYLGTINNGPSGVAGLFAPPAQTYTVNFESSGLFSEFTVTGTVTGFEGRGKLNTNFSWVSATGHLAINTATGGDFKDPAGGGVIKGETCTFEVLWRPTQGQGIIGAIRQFLLDPLGGGLTTDDLDLDTFTVLENTVSDQLLPNIGSPNVTRLAATEGNVLDAVAAFALHAGCALFETSDARLGLSSFMPRVVLDVPVLCKSADLMAAATGHLQIYNEFTVERTFDERNQKFMAGETWPPAADNDSQQRYGRRLPAPSSLAFRGYDGSNEPWTKTLAQVLYERHKDPRAVFSVVTKIERLDAELDDIYRLDSVGPDIQIRFTDPAVIDKNITRPLTVSMEVVETDVVTDGSCPGFLALDDPGKGLDNPCWGLF